MFFLFSFYSISGENGIRTRDTLLAYTRFPGVPLQPLEHLSFVCPSSKRGPLSNRLQITNKFANRKRFQSQMYSFFSSYVLFALQKFVFSAKINKL